LQTLHAYFAHFPKQHLEFTKPFAIWVLQIKSWQNIEPYY
jgi:hypothetical protein